MGLPLQGNGKQKQAMKLSDASRYEAPMDRKIHEHRLDL
jgi:hypothetical protein